MLKETLWLLWIIYTLNLLTGCYSADVVIRTPDEVGQLDGWYRLEYWPPQGSPPANRTFRPHEIANGIELSRALPGTEYNFRLFYTNASITDWLTWRASITTVPDPPSNLSINVRTGKVAMVSWDPPSVGGYSAFKLKVITLSGPQNSVKSLVVGRESSPFTLRDLTPGASYEIQLYTVYENKESAAYISTNFTTIPNTPGRFIVWFRNETTLLVLWQPPFPPGVYSLYKVSIQPTDAVRSVLYVEKEEPPGPAQAAFYGLVPGRAYNISVQTLSEDQISPPTTAQYRTVPLSPRNVTYDQTSLTSTSFKVTWSPPRGDSEFDRYSVSIGRRRQPPQLIPRDEPREGVFTNGILPGRTYTVVVKSVSGTVPSWPATGNVTTKPLPITDLEAFRSNETGEVLITWQPANGSLQDSYKVTYQDMDTGDASSATVSIPEFSMENLLPGRLYSIAVSARSSGIDSEEKLITHTTRPAPPIIKDLLPISEGLNISWKSDVTSKQDSYIVVYVRNDTAKEFVRKTHEPRIVLTNLYPGATYQIRIFAKSNELLSEPHVYFQAVYPNPPRNLKITNFTNSSLMLKWDPPEESKFDHYIVRYRAVDSSAWRELPIIEISDEPPSAEVTELVAGEKYVVEVNSVSNQVESAHPLSITQTVRPNSMTEVVPILDSHNVTFEWQRPEGRVDEYSISWIPTEPKHTKATSGSHVVSGDQATEGIDRLLSVVISGLVPGQLYKFKFNTTGHGLQSDPIYLDVRTMPLITSEVYIVDNRDDPRSLTLRYTFTPPSVTVLDEYLFTLASGSGPSARIDHEKRANDTVRKVTFSGLVPGRLYNITSYAVAGGVKSQPLVKQHRLYPVPITTMNATSITDSTITLRWDIPEGDHNAYEVQYLVDDGNLLLTNTTVSNTITLRNLHPHRNYTFTVQVVSGTVKSLMKRSGPVSATFTTREAVPGKVVEFRPIDIKPSKITFQWNLPPNHQNGILIGFTIRYGFKDSSYTLMEEFGPDTNVGTIYKLLPGRVYNFLIQASTKIGDGPVASFEQPMPIWPPPRPESHVFPTEVSRTTTTIRIRFRKNFFSNRNGDIVKYTVIVAEDYTKDSSGLELPSWWDVQDYAVWPAYQAIDPYNPFNHSGNIAEDFTIGAEVCGRRRQGYCNGPLKQGSVYRVKIRAFTAPNKFADSPYSSAIQTDQAVSSDTSGSNLVLGTVIPGLLVVIFVAILFILRRLNVGPFSRRKDKDPRHKDDQMSIADSVIVTSRPVKLKEFAEHYRLMSADSDFRFSEEYEELKHVGREQPCTAADLPVNRPKNRFTNILPYDHSRLKLNPTDDEEGSDYINANYVSGFNSPREFIVTQGPLHSTRDDFWRMTWESNSRAIVMLTRCIEKGREKCDYYWPYDTQPCYYGDIQVTILNESQYPDWTIREFKVQRGESSRVVRHFHFTTWPDFGVPDPPQTLVRFVRAYRDRVGPEQKPIVVHCSAGVGRSGTFIALDRLLQHMQMGSDSVDVFGIVWEMRRERVWMVQTEQQYICIHQCILAVLEGKENEGIPMREVHDNQGFEDDEGIAESGM